MDKDQIVKIIIMGDKKVGKSCILNKYVKEKFNENNAQTIGCDFAMKSCNQNGKTIYL